MMSNRTEGKILRAADSNVFIDAARNYPFDLFPGFWGFMSQSFRDDKLISAERVYDEITIVEGPLKEWIKPFKKYFLPANEDIILTRKKIGQCVESIYNDDKKIRRFFAGADAWLIATAIVEKAIVVTNEKRFKKTHPNSEVKIPNVCKALKNKLKVECEWNIFPFMAQEKVKLVWITEGK